MSKAEELDELDIYVLSLDNMKEVRRKLWEPYIYDFLTDCESYHTSYTSGLSYSGGSRFEDLDDYDKVKDIAFAMDGNGFGRDLHERVLLGRVSNDEIEMFSDLNKWRNISYTINFLSKLSQKERDMLLALGNDKIFELQKNYDFEPWIEGVYYDKGTRWGLSGDPDDYICDESTYVKLTQLLDEAVTKDYDYVESTYKKFVPESEKLRQAQNTVHDKLLEPYVGQLIKELDCGFDESSDRDTVISFYEHYFKHREMFGYSEEKVQLDMRRFSNNSEENRRYINNVAKWTDIFTTVNALSRMSSDDRRKIIDDGVELFKENNKYGGFEIYRLYNSRNDYKSNDVLGDLSDIPELHKLLDAVVKPESVELDKDKRKNMSSYNKLLNALGSESNKSIGISESEDNKGNNSPGR